MQELLLRMKIKYAIKSVGVVSALEEYEDGVNNAIRNFLKENYGGN